MANRSMSKGLATGLGSVVMKQDYPNAHSMVCVLAATRLAEAGCSEREIMVITGHKSVSEVSRYTRAADQSRLAEQATMKLTTARTNRDEKLFSTSNPLDKTGSK